MRVLGIETSSARGSVCLWDSGEVLSANYERANAHTEELLPTIRKTLKAADWCRGTIQRICVGIGPGSFTGARVGIALAEGIGLGLSIPVVGVGSLRALAAQSTFPGGPRVAVLPAGRGDFYVAVYDHYDQELQPPTVVGSDGLNALIPEDSEVLGTLPQQQFRPSSYRGGLLPSATEVAKIGSTLSPRENPATACYVRAPNAVVPKLPTPAVC